MEEYKKGTKFTPCNHKQLIENGWYDTVGLPPSIAPAIPTSLHHLDFPGDSINDDMLSIALSQKEELILTVDELQLYKTGWYSVIENNFNWPVATFLESNKVAEMINAHVCEEGQTPIFGWFICKFCGTNLKEIK